MQYDKTNINRVVFLSDIHLGVRTASTEWLENVQEYFDKFFIPLVKKYQKNKETVLLVIAGDFFDNRQHIDINVMNIGADIMKKLSKVLEVFVIIGNHDIYKKKDTDISSLRLFETFENVHVLHSITDLLLPGNHKMTLIPWVGDHKEEMKILSKQKNSDFVVMHTEIAGLNFDNGREIIDGTSVDSLKTGKIYSGHIHKRQESDRVVYLGAPYQLRRSDIGNVKGVYSLVFKDDEFKQEFIPNTYSSQFLRLRLGDILNLKTLELKKLVENNYVDIIVKKRHMNEINMAKLMEVMEECSTKKIEVILDKFDNDLTPQESVEISKDLTISDIFSANISKMDFSEEDRKTLEDMNKKYLALATEALGGE